MSSNDRLRSVTQESNLRKNSSNAQNRPLPPQGINKWVTLASTFVINVIVPGILPSLGTLIYIELQDPQILLRRAIWSPIFFIVSWCLADSWGHTAASTESFRKVAIFGSFVAGSSVAATFLIHDNYGSLTYLFLIGIVAGIALRLLMTITENILAAHFSAKSKSSLMVTFLARQSLSHILPPIIVVYFAHKDGVHYGSLMLAALIFHTLPMAFLLTKPKSSHSGRHLYLTNQPAYALLHDDDDDNEAAVNVQTLPDSGVSRSRQRVYDNQINTSDFAEQEVGQISECETEADNNPIPLFTDVNLVAGTYQGDIAFSFDDSQRGDANMNEDVDIFVRGSTGYRTTKYSQRSCCCRCFRSQSFKKEFHPFTHPAFYLGLISMLAQKVTTLAIWVLLPSLISTFRHTNIHGYLLTVPENIGIAIISVLTGVAALPVVFFIPSLLHPSSYLGRRIIHGLSTVIAALGVFGIGKNLDILQIGALLFFGLSNAVSESTLEPLLKEALLGSDHFLGYKTRERDWGQIRGLANTIVGLLILTVGLTIDILTTDWNHIDWSLIFYLMATVQAFAGLIWIILPSTFCH